MFATPRLSSDPLPASVIGDTGALHRFVSAHAPLFVLTGAGCSTASGIPDYRDQAGAWKRPPPVSWQAFRGEHATRQRYWARSLIGWPRFALARPNATHLALALMEQVGRIQQLVTQNVDGLHQAAGSRRVIDLHGRLDQVVCMECGDLQPRAEFQQRLAATNPDWLQYQAATAPDGDADLDGHDFSGFSVPACVCCGGMQKPDVVFFGEGVPAERVADSYAALRRSSGVLVLGSSLMVRSGLRFVEQAVADGKPVAAVNLGRTRADPLLSLKVETDCATALVDWLG